MFRPVRRLRKLALPLRRLFGDRCVVPVDGRPMMIDLADEGFTARLYYRREHDPLEIAFLRTVLRPGMTVYDVGANIGLYTVPLAEMVGPAGRVAAFEPFPENRELLETNIGLNHLENVTVVPGAVAAAPGELSLYLSGRNSGDHRIFDQGSPKDQRATITVPAVSLDAFSAEQGRAPDFIKSDIQGAEWQMWQGMQGLVAAQPRLKILAEFWPWGIEQCGGDPATLLAELAAAGFRIQTLEGTAEAPRLRPWEPAGLLAGLKASYTNIYCDRQT